MVNSISKKSGAGFTLLEITVVISIIILLSTIFIANYRGGEKQFALKRSANKLAQDLRMVQGLSMSSKSYSCPPGYEMKGYGINLPVGSDYYWLKARCENQTSPGIYDDQIVGESIKLEKEVKISAASPVNIFFYPPEPEIDLGAAAIAQITLCLKTDITKTKTVTINKVGLIDID